MHPPRRAPFPQSVSWINPASVVKMHMSFTMLLLCLTLPDKMGDRSQRCANVVENSFVCARRFRCVLRNPESSSGQCRYPYQVAETSNRTHRLPASYHFSVLNPGSSLVHPQLSKVHDPAPCHRRHIMTAVMDWCMVRIGQCLAWRGAKFKFL